MYYTGICANFGEIKSALVEHCVANGWTETTDSGGNTVIYKDDMYLRITTDSARVIFLARTSVDGGSAPREVCITHFDPNYEGHIVFPVTYYAFVFSNEVFFVINYGERYQYVAFGKSSYSLPGTGMWVSATARYPSIYPYRINLNSDGYVREYDTASAMFWTSNYSYLKNSLYPKHNSWIHTNIDPNYPWALGTTNTSDDLVGIQYLTELLVSQPNIFNQESLILPIKAFKRSHIYSDKCYEVLTVQNARHFVLSYVEPKDIIYRGSEQWMVFPWFRRSLSAYGWAIRKE